jgi:hypothetical protein
VVWDGWVRLNLDQLTDDASVSDSRNQIERRIARNVPGVDHFTHEPHQAQGLCGAVGSLERRCRGRARLTDEKLQKRLKVVLGRRGPTFDPGRNGDVVENRPALDVTDFYEGTEDL